MFITNNLLSLAFNITLSSIAENTFKCISNENIPLNDIIVDEMSRFCKLLRIIYQRRCFGLKE